MKSIKNVIKNKSGASVLFVLAVMLMLMAIGTSALAAAQAAAGANKVKSNYNQLNLYADSVQKAIMHSLQVSYNNPTDPLKSDNGKLVTSANTMAGKLLEKMYPTKGTIPSVGTTTLVFNASSSALDLKNVSDITITITPSFSVIPEVLMQNAILDTKGNVIMPGTPWQPEAVIINGDVNVTLEITDSVTKKKIKSIVAYQLIDGYLVQNATGANAMLIKDAGEWRFISHEKLAI